MKINLSIHPNVLRYKFAAAIPKYVMPSWNALSAELDLHISGTAHTDAEIAFCGKLKPLLSGGLVTHVALAHSDFTHGKIGEHLSIISFINSVELIAPCLIKQV